MNRRPWRWLARGQLAPHPMQRGARGAFLEPRDRRLGGQGSASHRVTSGQQPVDGVGDEMLGDFAVRMTAADAEDPLAEQVPHRVPELAEFAPVYQTANEPATSPCAFSAFSSTAPPSELVCG